MQYFGGLAAADRRTGGVDTGLVRIGETGDINRCAGVQANDVDRSRGVEGRLAQCLDAGSVSDVRYDTQDVTAGGAYSQRMRPGRPT